MNNPANKPTDLPFLSMSGLLADMVDAAQAQPQPQPKPEPSPMSGLLLAVAQPAIGSNRVDTLAQARAQLEAERKAHEATLAARAAEHKAKVDAKAKAEAERVAAHIAKVNVDAAKAKAKAEAERKAKAAQEKVRAEISARLRRRNPGKATWAKLSDGSWGVRAPGAVVGDTVTVTKKNGQKTRVTLGSKVSNGLFRKASVKAKPRRVCPGNNNCRRYGWPKGPRCSP